MCMEYAADTQSFGRSVDGKDVAVSLLWETTAPDAIRSLHAKYIRVVNGKDIFFGNEFRCTIDAP